MIVETDTGYLDTKTGLVYNITSIDQKFVVDVYSLCVDNSRNCIKVSGDKSERLIYELRMGM